jgi:hypothetical protein
LRLATNRVETLQESGFEQTLGRNAGPANPERGFRNTVAARALARPCPRGRDSRSSSGLHLKPR